MTRHSLGNQTPTVYVYVASKTGEILWHLTWGPARPKSPKSALSLPIPFFVAAHAMFQTVPYCSRASNLSAVVKYGDLWRTATTGWVPVKSKHDQKPAVFFTSKSDQLGVYSNTIATQRKGVRSMHSKQLWFLFQTYPNELLFWGVPDPFGETFIRRAEQSAKTRFFLKPTR